MPASLRISELNQVTTLSDGDLFLVTDASESTSKKLTLLALKQDLFSGNSFPHLMMSILRHRHPLMGNSFDITLLKINGKLVIFLCLLWAH